MCKVELLRTTPKRVKDIEKRSGEIMPGKSQIQYYSECIRAFASKRNIHVDVSLNLIESKKLFPIIEEAYSQNRKVFVAVRRMQAALE